jgi:hypothetical protein
LEFDEYTNDINLISKQYKILAMKYHPDRCKSIEGESEIDKIDRCNTMFAELSNAYKKIQPYLVKKFPKLDVEIVKNLQYEWSFYQMPLWDTERYIAENNFNPTEYFSLNDLENKIFHVQK